MEWEPETNLAGVLLNCFRSQIKLLRKGEREREREREGVEGGKRKGKVVMQLRVHI